MYYYGGYSGGYGSGCGCNNFNYSYPCCGGNYGGYGNGYGSAIILVLFILLVIIIGSRVVT